ncbi:MAG: peroxiredoxin [Gammaproteobacteria bacterium]|uniref:peroxiredoxin n=1 Tax=Limnobacter sp. TaxID=2003368 RepID=UPI001D98ABFE|nr:peroxiredoxin [Limnobacter sp.]MBU0783530.1 peroxiredoxin [Gammaproteobacteria bacterium]MBU0848624.1 peroxiredoxin [Gammaproteobacteria bacterium]MBU1267600.1 peroxiredoxin [Gammaproteobacteria bacterium]MBU1529826.1 peroxiredoxin [Gammaproteobacteria bacterium]MBU1780155.1 peroxiredoxin [Gammaproteobacteria bacterium]
MTIQIGDKLPNATLFEFFHEETEGCSLGPNKFEVETELAGKTVAILALPGAYTPTCSAKHVPGFLDHFNEFKAKGVDEIWCISVNDAFVMGMWGKSLGAEGKVRMMADGSAEFTKKIGMELDLTGRGMGVRSNRYSMLVKNGVVTQLNVEAPGVFENSTAEKLLSQI